MDAAGASVVLDRPGYLSSLSMDVAPKASASMTPLLLLLLVGRLLLFRDGASVLACRLDMVVGSVVFVTKTSTSSALLVVPAGERQRS